MTPAEARIQDPELSSEDEFDRSLRPRRLEDLVGQEAVKDQLAVSTWLSNISAEPRPAR